MGFIIYDPIHQKVVPPSPHYLPPLPVYQVAADWYSDDKTVSQPASQSDCVIALILE